MIIALSRIIPQNILFVLECEREYRLTVYHTKLIQIDWLKNIGIIELEGLDLEAVWENIITQLGNIQI